MKKAFSEIRLVRATKRDYRFIYDLVKDWLEHNDHSVTALRIPSFSKFFKTKSTRYIIKKGHERIGFVHILGNSEVGYYLVPKFHGMGIGTWAVAQLMNIQPRDRYFATISRKNIASIKLITKLGFRPKGIIYEKIIKKRRRR